VTGTVVFPASRLEIAPDTSSSLLRNGLAGRLPGGYNEGVSMPFPASR
jgi:hypothetical protein